MKTKQLLCAAIATALSIGLFFTSCEKQTEAESLKQPVSSQVNRSQSGAEIRAHILTLSPTSQRSYFESLSGSDKVAVWLDKIESVKNLSGWSENQVALLDSFELSIVAGIWDVNSEQEYQFVNVFLPNWLEDAEQEFTRNQLGWTIATLDDYDPSGPFSPPNSDDCDCSVSDDWCPQSFTCKLTNCATSAHGCGTLWVRSCRGECGF